MLLQINKYTNTFRSCGKHIFYILHVSFFKKLTVFNKMIGWHLAKNFATDEFLRKNTLIDYNPLGSKYHMNPNYRRS